MQHELHKTVTMAAEFDHKLSKRLDRHHKHVMRAVSGKRSSHILDDSASVSVADVRPNILFCRTC